MDGNNRGLERESGQAGSPSTMGGEILQLALLDKLDHDTTLDLAEELGHESLNKDIFEFLEEWEKKMWQVWRIEGQNTRLTLVTCVHTENGRKELLIYLLYGTGWIHQLPRMRDLLVPMAKDAGFACLSGFARNKAMARIYRNFGAVSRDDKYFTWSTLNG